MHCTCAFDHVPQSGKVFFISRYRDENNYCVAGQRIRVFDNGDVYASGEPATPAQLTALRLFLLEEYARYCKWHCDIPYRGVPLQPFDYSRLFTMEVR